MPEETAPDLPEPTGDVAVDEEGQVPPEPPAEPEPEDVQEADLTIAMIPTPGRIVEYELTEWDVQEINRRRADARSSQLDQRKSGAVVHVGNEASTGERFPMVIVRVWGEGNPGSSVNGQVLLDGNDTYWATSRHQGHGPGNWHPYPRV